MFKNAYIFLTLVVAVQANTLTQPAPTQILTRNFSLNGIKKEVESLRSLLNQVKEGDTDHQKRSQVNFKKKLKEATKILNSIDKAVKNVDLQNINIKIDDFYRVLEELNYLESSPSENLEEKSSLKNAGGRYNPPIRQRRTHKKKKEVNTFPPQGKPIIIYKYTDSKAEKELID